MSEPCGVLCIDKAVGGTSFDAVAAVRRLYATKKVGHTGTLDPMATGVLVVLVGRAAKAADFLVADEKRYLAELQLGITTDTEDTTGTVLTRADALPSAEQVRAVCASFVGEILQVPPMYSALKVGGQKLVDLARRGVEVERTPRPITVHSLSVEVLDEAQGRYRLAVHCSKGTYIRTLCADIGAKLGCGGAMAALRREQSGRFALSDCTTLDALSQMDNAARLARLLPLESLFADLERVVLPPFFARLAQCGCVIYQHKIKTAIPLGTRVTLWDAQGFFALAEATVHEGEAVLKVIKQFRI
jgi:tRNA pseudouridine55 synthase